MYKLSHILYVEQYTYTLSVICVCTIFIEWKHAIEWKHSMSRVKWKINESRIIDKYRPITNCTVSSKQGKKFLSNFSTKSMHFAVIPWNATALSTYQSIIKLSIRITRTKNGTFYRCYSSLNTVGTQNVYLFQLTIILSTMAPTMGWSTRCINGEFVRKI